MRSNMDSSTIKHDLLFDLIRLDNCLYHLIYDIKVENNYLSLVNSVINDINKVHGDINKLVNETLYDK